MLDAPVSGTVATLLEGKLLVMVGGRKEVFEKREAAARGL
jgi:3-hydroxyisobutyrate dehydrogenase-like beta-hydroxyacid dehydrogenase